MFLATKKSTNIWMPKRTQRQCDGKRPPHSSKRVSMSLLDYVTSVILYSFKESVRITTH